MGKEKDQVKRHGSSEERVERKRGRKVTEGERKKRGYQNVKETHRHNVRRLRHCTPWCMYVCMFVGVYVCLSS